MGTQDTPEKKKELLQKDLIDQLKKVFPDFNEQAVKDKLKTKWWKYGWGETEMEGLKRELNYWEGIEKLHLPEGNLKEVIDGMLDGIERVESIGKEETPTDKKTLSLFDKKELEKIEKQTPAKIGNIAVDKNLAEIPKADYSGKAKEHYITFKNDNIKTEIGSMYGAWTGKDERLFMGVICRNTRFYKHKDKRYLISHFTTYEGLKDLNLSTGGADRNWLHKACEKIGATILSHSKFLVAGNEDSYILEQLKLFIYKAIILQEGNVKKGYHIFVWDNIFYLSYLLNQIKYINFERWLALPDDLTRAIYVYVKKKLGKKIYYPEDIDKIINRVGIRTKSKSKARKYLLDKIKYLKANGDIGKYIRKDNRLIIYNTGPEGKAKEIKG